MKSRTNKLLSVLLALCMLLSLMPASVVFAVEQAGDFLVTGENGNYNYDSETGILTITKNGTYTIVGNGSETTDRIVVNSGITANITIENVDINTTNSAMEINGTCNLTVRGENNLASQKGTGVQLTGNSVFVITKESTGKLSAFGGDTLAGIGSFGGKVIIEGGYIYARGGSGGAAIGGYSGGGSGCNVTISGGTVDAHSHNASGIGAGWGNGGQGTFITGSDGNAVIYASSISDMSDKENWSGVIFIGNEGKVYGQNTVSQNIDITKGQKLTVPVNKSITFTNEYSLNNNGGALVVDGTVNGNVTNSGEGNISGQITGNVQNDGTIYLSGVIKGDITNTGAGYVLGTINGNITNTGAGYILGTINGNVTNSGGLYVEGSVTGTITNNGTIYKQKNTALPEDTEGNIIECDENVWTSVGDLEVKGGIFFRDYKYENNTITIEKDSNLQIRGTTTQDRIVVNSGVTANITIENVDINTTNSAMEINGTCNLTVLGENNLASQKGTGVQLTGNSVFVITKESTGKLSASGGDTLAGIGSLGGKVIIEGGYIYARGGSGGAAIGGYSGGGSGCDVTISGGTVDAHSPNASGIGAGWGNGSTGNFKTGNDGNAVIYASSIGDRKQMANWSGVIFISNEGNVYGNPKVSENIDVSGKALTIPKGKTLTLDENTITLGNGTINIDGKIEGSGTIDLRGGTADGIENVNITNIKLICGVSTNLENAVIDGGEKTEANNKEDFTIKLKGAEGYLKPKSVQVTVGETVLGSDGYTYNSETGELIISKEYITGNIVIAANGATPITFEVINKSHIYDGNAKAVAVVPPKEDMTAEDFTALYYKVDEDNDRLYSDKPVKQAITSGKYLYVIDVIAEQLKYGIARKYTVADTVLPDITAYDNIGYMTISATAEQQKPIYYAAPSVSKFVTDEAFTNELTNANVGSKVTYTSSNPDVAAIDADGNVTIKGAGSTVIMATAEKENASPVYANYTLEVKKKPVTVTAKSDSVIYGSDWTAQENSVEISDGLSLSDFDGELKWTTDYKVGSNIGRYEITPSGLNSDKYDIIYKSANLTVTPKELTENDFEVTAADKVYDGTTDVKLTASVKPEALVPGDNVTVEISGSFEDKNAGENKTVTYTITGLGGANSANYKINGDIQDKAKANIAKAAVTISAPKNTSYVYDGEEKSVNVTAFANGMAFDGFTVSYEKDNAAAEPKAVGQYKVLVKLNDEDNYTTDYDSSEHILEIKSAVQDVFSIEGIPESVKYGDKFTLQTAGANGDVKYEITEGKDFVNLDGDTITAKAVGTVTVKATSKLNNHADKTASRTFTIGKRVVTPIIEKPTERDYNGDTKVDVNIQLDNVLEGDTLTATANGSMATADAGMGKTVFVNDITLSDDTNYTLSTTSGQTTIDINKLKITDFTISAEDKTYDGNKNAIANVEAIQGVLENDKDSVSLVGSAAFNSAEVETAGTVTYMAIGISGYKSGNYEFADDNAKTATANAKITPAEVKFNFGSLSGIYNGSEQEPIISATLNGAVFTDYTVTYNGGTDRPKDAGDYEVAVTLNSTNYTGVPEAKTYTILSADQKELTITGLSGTLDYGRELALSVIGGEGDGDIKWDSSDTDVATVENGKVSIVGVGDVTITVTKEADGNYNEQSTSVTFTTTQKAVSIRLSDLSQVYGDNKEVKATANIDGVETVVTYTDESGNTTTDRPTGAGTYFVAAAPKDTAHYEGEISGVLTIAKAKITDEISIAMNGGTYGTALTAAEVTGNPTGTNVTVTYAGTGIYTPQSDIPTNAGKYKAIAAVSGANYETQTVEKEFEITKKELTVRADSQTRRYGEANPILTFTYNGFADGDNAENAVLVEPTAATSATAQSPTGDYEITLNGGRSDNYTFKYEKGTLTVTADDSRTLEILGGSDTAKVGGSFKLTARYGIETPSVKWTVDKDTATIDQNGKVTFNKADTVTITAEMDDNNFGKKTATLTVTVSKEKIRLFANDVIKTYNGEVQYVTLYAGTSEFELTSDNVKITYTKNGAEAEPKEAGTYTVTYEIIDDKFEGSGSFTLTINKENAGIVISNLSQVYDGNPKSVKVSGVAEYDITYKDENENVVEPIDAGTYYVNVTAKGNSQGSANAVLTIAKAKLDKETINVAMESGIYGTPIAEANVTGNPTGTDVTVTYTGTGIFTPHEDVPTNAGKYKAIAEITGKNYEDITVTQDFEIEKATLTVTVDPASREFGKANPEFVLHYDGFKYGEDEGAIEKAPTAYCEADAQSPAGSGYTITVSGGYAENYVFDCTATGTLTVTPNTSGTLYIDGGNKNVVVGDEFTLRAHYGTEMPSVKWESSNEGVAAIDENGNVTILSAGNATITATVTDSGYSAEPAVFELEASKKNITLSAPNNVKTFNNDIQKLELKSNDSNFVIDDNNVKVTYTLTTDVAVTEPKRAGVYSVYYEIEDERYAGSGSFTMYINKAPIVVKAKDITKEYGEENPAYELEIVTGAEIADAEYLKSLVTFKSAADETGKLTKAGEYEITAEFTKEADDNYTFKASETNGKLIVTKAPLTVTVKNVSREYGAENPQLEAEYTGFKNDETAEALTGELTLTYAESINAETAVGTYTGVTAAAGLTSDNYEISYVSGDVTVTKIAVKASAGAARKTYLTVKLDKPISGLTAANFVVKNGEETIALTEVTPSSDNKTYTLKGSFSTSVTYTVETNLTGTESEATHEITSEPLSVKPSTSGGSGGGGGGGGSSLLTAYIVTFEANGGSKIAGVKVTKNDTLKKPTDPTKDGYTFDGWYSDKELTKAYDFGDKVIKTFTLYAKWIEDRDEPTDPTDPTKPSEWKNPFTDVKTDDWFYDSVKYAAENGLFDGTTDTTFAPNEAITRGMLVTVLWRMEEKPVVNYLMTFTDIENEAYYTEAVRWAASERIVKGYSDEEFAPNKKISREEMAAILHRYADCKGIDTSARGDLTKFTDEAQVADWARENVGWAAGTGLLTGKGNHILDPNGNTTRAETAAMLERLQNTIK